MDASVQFPSRLPRVGTTIFTTMSALAAAHGAVNLGQGFPDFDGPEELKQAAADAIRGGLNQYAVTTGAPALRTAIARHALRFYGQRVDPDTEVVVTSGATEAIFDAVMAFVDPGDEVVLFEPWYDSYQADVQMAGGVPRYVLLRPPDVVQQRREGEHALVGAALGAESQRQGEDPLDVVEAVAAAPRGHQPLRLTAHGADERVAEHVAGWWRGRSRHPAPATGPAARGATPRG